MRCYRLQQNDLVNIQYGRHTAVQYSAMLIQKRAESKPIKAQRKAYHDGVREVVRQCVERVEDLLAEEDLLAVGGEDEDDGRAPRSPEAVPPLLLRPPQPLRGLQQLLQPQVRHLRTLPVALKYKPFCRLHPDNDQSAQTCPCRHTLTGLWRTVACVKHHNQSSAAWKV